MNQTKANAIQTCLRYKKIIIGLLAFLLIVCMCACNSNIQGSSGNTTVAITSQVTTESTVRQTTEPTITENDIAGIWVYKHPSATGGYIYFVYHLYKGGRSEFWSYMPENGNISDDWGRAEVLIEQELRGTEKITLGEWELKDDIVNIRKNGELAYSYEYRDNSLVSITGGTNVYERVS